MSDSEFVKIDDPDPAAEFLAREKDVMAEIENDIATVTINGEKNETTAPTSNELETNGSVEENHVDRQPSSSPKTVFKEPEVEPEKIRIWREEQIEYMKAKDEQEAIKKQELAEQATKELAEWYARYQEQLEKSKITNRYVNDLSVVLTNFAIRLYFNNACNPGRLVSK